MAKKKEESTQVVESTWPISDKGKLIMMTTDEIETASRNILQHFVYYEGDIWCVEKGLWTNVTGTKTSKNYDPAFRLVIKKYLKKNYMYQDRQRFDHKIIDIVAKEVKTNIQEKEIDSDSFPDGIMFKNGILYIDENNQISFDAKKKLDFTPFQIKYDFNSKKFNSWAKGEKTYVDSKGETQQIQQDNIFDRFATNLVGPKGTNARQAYMAFLGYCLAAEHCGVSIILNGPTTIGKSTTANLVEFAHSGKMKQDKVAKVQQSYIYDNKFDQFDSTALKNKVLVYVGEGKAIMDTEAVSRYNDLIDETAVEFSMRDMRAIAKPVYKSFNLMLFSNTFPLIKGNQGTLEAFNKRTIKIQSNANGPILDSEEYSKLFSKDEMELFMFEAALAYGKAKITKKKRIDKFPLVNCPQFISAQQDSNVAALLLELLISANDIGDGDLHEIGELWDNNKLDKLTNNEMSIIIAYGRRKYIAMSKTYSTKDFANDLTNYCKEHNALIEIKETSVWKNGKTNKGIILTWNQEFITLKDDGKYAVKRFNNLVPSTE